MHVVLTRFGVRWWMPLAGITGAVAVFAGLLFGPRPVDIGAALARIHADRAIAFDLTAPDALVAGCEAHDIEEIFGNLLCRERGLTPAEPGDSARVSAHRGMSRASATEELELMESCIHDPADHDPAACAEGTPRVRPGFPPPRAAMLAVALLAAAGVGAGAAALATRDHRITIVALAPQPVSALKNGTMVSVKGDVAEIFGDKFVIADESGQALVETGPRGEDLAMVALKEPVTVQGRFDHGFMHAIAITHADGRVDALRPPPPPPGGAGPRPPA